tara:strand:- start:1159 stop:1710 length:552 start_codon:yes stop_codon:yes gene_type:complete
MANLKIEIRESIVLNENSYDSYNKQTLAGINNVSKRVLTVPTTESVLISMDDTNIGAGTFKEEDVRYIRITNQSTEYPLLLTLKNENNNEYIYKLDKESTFIYSGEADTKEIFGTSRSGSGVINSTDASDNAITGVDTSFENLGDLVNITGMASGSTADLISGSAGSGSGDVRCPVELFIASI